MQTTPAETPTVAKKQRSLQLPDEAFDLIAAFEAKTGAKFNRVILAAVLKFFCDEPFGVESRWMEFAVQVERGQLAIGDVPLANAISELTPLDELMEKMKAAQPGFEAGRETYPVGYFFGLWHQAAKKRKDWEDLYKKHALDRHAAVVDRFGSQQSPPFFLPTLPSRD